jgi:hypothetical protein
MTPRFSSAWQALVLCAGLALSPLALSATPAAAPAPDPEEQIDEGLKGFGYMAGLALGCVAAEQRKALEREAMDLNAEISRLLGIDRAFLFTAGFGHGTGVELKVDDCKAVLTRYEARVAKFRQGKGGK